MKKNRFDGEVGEVSMLFNPENKRYFEITTEEKQRLLLTGGNFKSIINTRIEKYGMVEPVKEKEEHSKQIDIKTNKPYSE